ncbi:MAG: hypothetical protein II311_02520 [Lachnospiraceae bacterium]|nr:hypothetical protein [Lachnospiraceae bacterium]
MRKTSMTKVAAAAMAAAMMLTACGGGNAATATTAAPAADNGAAATQTEAASTGATITDTDIVVAMGADIVTMDPANQNDTTSSVLMNHVYNTLMEVNDDGELVGDLAESYEIVDDGKAYIFHLYENACFSDGTPVTAEDVKFTYERAMESAKTKSDVEAVESIEVIDEHTVKMNLKKVYAPFITKTTDTGLCILSKAATEAAGEAYGDVDTVLGSGAFIPTEWVPNDHYTLVRNENYWKETPIATSIEVRVIPEGSARTIALEAGEVDIVWNVDAIDCVNVEANPDVLLLSQPSASIEYMGMNTSKEKFSDVRVRQAINMAIDQQVFIDTIVEGRGTPANSYINSMIPGWTDEVTAYEYDLEKAKALMAEAGYPDGFDCSIYVNGDNRTRSATIVQAQLAEIGINVEISTYEWGALLEILTKGDHELFFLGWSNSSFDADGSTFALFHSSNFGATGNRAWLDDEQVDSLIEAAQVEVDHEKRMDLYKQLQFRLKELAPWVPMYYKDDNVGVRADLKGFRLHKGATHWIGNAHYEE